MKKMKWILTVVAVLIMSVGFANVKNNDFTKCEITKVDDIFVNKDVKAMWTLSYSEKEVPVTVIKHEKLSGTEYVVHSKYFDVTYAQTETGFGIVDTRKSCVIVNKKISNAIINQKECEKQRILTPNKIDDEMAIGLISAYLPQLINDDYTHILN